MVRERTPARKTARTGVKTQLGDSWVVESESDGDDEYTPPKSLSSSRRLQTSKQSQSLPDPVHRTRPSANNSAEPEFIMPLLSNNGSGSSWTVKEKWREQPEQKETRSNAALRDKRQKPRVQHGATLQDRAENLGLGILQFMKPVIYWIYQVLGEALQYCRKPISLALALWLLMGASIVLHNLFFSSIYTALSPLCRIPGSRFLNLPMCQNSAKVQYSSEDLPPVQFDQLMTVQNQFEAVLQESAGGVSLPLDMKRGETSIRDLRQIVRFSQLRSRNELVLEFDGFIETARIASYELQKFNSHVGRGVDKILATARWTKRVLDGIADQDSSQGAIAWFFNDKVLAPFQPVKFTESAVLDQYIQHTRIVEEEISQLVAEAQALLMILQNLEDRLDVINGVAIRDNIHVQGSKAEILSQLWTMLGGNRNKLGKFESQLKLLSQVDSYRQNAIAHVTGTMIRLQGMGTELEELRERVGSVELLGGGRGAVPLSVHIENIELGVERLENVRKGAKELENEELRRTLDRGKDGGGGGGGARAIEGR